MSYVITSHVGLWKAHIQNKSQLDLLLLMTFSNNLSVLTSNHKDLAKAQSLSESKYITEVSGVQVLHSQRCRGSSLQVLSSGLVHHFLCPL